MNYWVLTYLYVSTHYIIAAVPVSTGAWCIPRHEESQTTS